MNAFLVVLVLPHAGAGLLRRVGAVHAIREVLEQREAAALTTMQAKSGYHLRVCRQSAAVGQAAPGVPKVWGRS